MPIYEYKCDGCGHRLEVLQKHDDPPPICASCDENVPPICASCDENLPPETPYMSRQVSASSFRLEGHGWARDNYGLKGDG